MKVGNIVEHRDTLESGRKGRGRIVFSRKGATRALVKWENGECVEHHYSVLRHVHDK